MPNENNNPNQIIVVINAECNQISVSLSIPLSNEVNLVQQHNAIQDHQLSDLENRISALETNFGHQVCRNEDLQDIVNFCYPQD
ncbi:hypothetical protein FD724_27345 [Nostoc sp. C057]|uniref:hypothetical protein n=1 Tax=Nostoc sp. C057 TaxID=2576903 RepID=UPI0015C2D3E4|nr:hypothetical protein [Nostoc sp. C057]QLE51427.1 hypothetical protein FD724_27345 [Nostoc sp. C057]